MEHQLVVTTVVAAMLMSRSTRFPIVIFASQWDHEDGLAAVNRIVLGTAATSNHDPLWFQCLRSFSDQVHQHCSHGSFPGDGNISYEVERSLSPVNAHCWVIRSYNGSVGIDSHALTSKKISSQ